MTPGPTDRPAANRRALTADERRKVSEVLSVEYGLLMGALAAVWSASLVRTSIFLGVISAAGVALGFAAQSGIATLTSFAAIVVPLALLLGLGTFVRTVELQRESIVYITGLNRIRHFFQESVPASKPYFVLPGHDDEAALFRSQGTGMPLRRPRSWLVIALVQMQGIVAVVCGLLAAVAAWLLTSGIAPDGAWLVAVASFAATVVILFGYWNRSLAGLRGAIRPISPTPPEEIDAPI
jgi:hypothetical protein